MVHEADLAFGRAGWGDTLPLVMGSVFGHRGWVFDGEKLVSPQQLRYNPWTAGEQISMCVKTDPWGYSSYVIDRKGQTGHMKNCSCGFYAYFHGFKNRFAHNVNHKRSNVVGVLEGYGETIVGTKGFRSSKARIVALAPYNCFERVDWKFSGFASMLRETFPDAMVFPNRQSMFWHVPLTKANEFDV